MCVIFSPDCSYSIRLLDKLQNLSDESNVSLDFERIKKAIIFAKKYHDGQYRKSGEPFYTHPLEVAYMVSDYNLKTDVIITSILHDVVEDTEAIIGMILDEFGWRIAEMVDMLTRDRPDGSKLSVETILNNAYEKNDNEVLLIKVLDRMHNLNSVSHIKSQKIEKQIEESCNSRFPAITTIFSLDLEKKFFSILKKNDTKQIHKSAYKTDYTSLRLEDSRDFQLPSIQC
mgnify:CR=1 FL=1|jgi:(p)ppGpp synthase/HD superfamily hydrolase